MVSLLRVRYLSTATDKVGVFSLAFQSKVLDFVLEEIVQRTNSYQTIKCEDFSKKIISNDDERYFRKSIANAWSYCNDVQTKNDCHGLLYCNEAFKRFR